MNSNDVSIVSISKAKGKKVPLLLNKKHKKIEVPSTSDSWEEALINAAADKMLGSNNKNSRDIIVETGMTREELDILTPDIFQENVDSNSKTTKQKINIISDIVINDEYDIEQVFNLNNDNNLTGIEPLNNDNKLTGIESLSEHNGQVWNFPATDESKKYSQISQSRPQNHIVKGDNIMNYFRKIRKDHVSAAQQKALKLKGMLKHLKDKKLLLEMETFLKINQKIYFSLNEEESLQQYFSLEI